MTKQFIQKILSLGSVDTRDYRYIVKECYNANEQWREIYRLPIKDLDTTEAINGWEKVVEIR